MTSITYIPNIPFATHNPSTDQPNMEINTNAVPTILAVDHVTFNLPNGGTHNHVTFANGQTDPSLPSGQTQIYPKTFGSPTTYLETYTASTSSASLQINGYLPFVKCMGRFTGSVGPYPVTFTPAANTLNVNIASITQTSSTSVTVTFTTALAYNTYYVFFENASLPTITLTKNTGNFVIQANFGTLNPVGFMVI